MHKGIQRLADAVKRPKPAQELETLPNLSQLEAELSREKYRSRFGRVLRSTVYALIVVAAVAVLVATLWMPVLQIYGSSMTPSLQDGEIVISVKDTTPEPGDVIAFYYNNKVLVKRVVGSPGDWVDIDRQGNVSLNGEILEEPYLEEKDRGEVTIDLPYQVPESKVFVLGDHRSVSVDSRNGAIGCIEEEQIVGKIVFRVWPLSAFGVV